jgi:N-acetyl-anhydromuramyl-L-alanine amidase AmpD
MKNNFIDEDQYFKQAQKKNQIVIHHTAGGSSAINAIHGWNFTPERVGTAFVIDGAGEVYKAFEPEFWAHHLGMKTGRNIQLNKASIGIEICNWGQLILKDGKYYSYVNKEVPADQVVKIGKFKGYEYFHKYNEAQLAALKTLVIDLSAKFGIPRDFNMDIFDLNQRAVTGVAGIYTHVSYRTDKADVNPQPNLIKTLKEIQDAK